MNGKTTTSRRRYARVAFGVIILQLPHFDTVGLVSEREAVGVIFEYLLPGRHR